MEELKIATNEQNQTLEILRNELKGCQSFIFCVAFISQSGLNCIKTALFEAFKRGVKGKIITSNYLNFNSPQTFLALLNLPNVEVFICEDELHSKGYFFDNNCTCSVLLGSSNLTFGALNSNSELNIFLKGQKAKPIYTQILQYFENLPLKILNKNWIENYAKTYVENRVIERRFDKIEPNEVQLVALKNLQNLREKGLKKALINAATGIGKTYLSAFDALQFLPKKVLFIAHRDLILKSAKQSFERVFLSRNFAKINDFGFLIGEQKQIQAKFLFASIQTLCKDENLKSFSVQEFDYIIIDEVHKAGARSYQKIINYLKPKFLLGMSATIQRSDGFDINALFDGNIAYEISLQSAIKQKFLAPFFYFGVSEFQKDEEIISDVSELKNLVLNERAKFLIEKLEFYGQVFPKCLVFCRFKEEAKSLSQIFNSFGLKSSFLTSEDLRSKREIEILKLKSGKINYIFTVDLFNEGVDIPEINQIVMLRPTNSNIIFTQQLGRGLRKHKSKEFLTVIDFIGNYKSSFLIAQLFSSSNFINKSILRKNLIELNNVSNISFEQIAKEQIFKAISSAKFDSLKEFRTNFNELENALQKEPKLSDFGDFAKEIIFNFGNYQNFLIKIGKNRQDLTKQQNAFLLLLSRELANGVRLNEIKILQMLIENEILNKDDVLKEFTKNKILSEEKSLNCALKVLSNEFFVGIEKKNYLSFLQIKDDKIKISLEFKQALQSEYFKDLLFDCFKFTISQNSNFDNLIELTNYQKYRRKDALRALNFEKQVINQAIGGYIYNENEFLIFINLQKNSYENEFIDSKTLPFFTRSPRNLQSPEVNKLKQNRIHIFVKKSDESEFYYLGVAKLKTLETILKEQKSCIKVILTLYKEVPKDLFEYFIM